MYLGTQKNRSPTISRRKRSRRKEGGQVLYGGGSAVFFMGSSFPSYQAWRCSSILVGGGRVYFNAPRNSRGVWLVAEGGSGALGAGHFFMVVGSFFLQSIITASAPTWSDIAGLLAPLSFFRLVLSISIARRAPATLADLRIAINYLHSSATIHAFHKQIE